MLDQCSELLFRKEYLEILLKKRGIEYNITKQYPNGVRVGNVSNHKDKQKRDFDKQTWFPKNWTRKTIKKAGEKTINSIPYKLPDGMNTFGTYKKVKVVVKRTNGRVHTIFPYYKQELLYLLLAF